MYVLLGLVLSFGSAVAYGMLFNVPVRTLLAGGTVGMLAWLIFKSLPVFGAQIGLATFAAATFISLASQWLSVKLRVPSTNFSTAGIIPLVPGSTAYKTMLSFVNGDYLQGITLAVETCVAAGAIAAGLTLGLSLFSIWKGIVARYAPKSAKAN
ncbi:threonine/serine exporter family protein [Brevibacillus dissolubilis]|uniref:threonine/serine exporter family protein n=1 Tax=Brevibacillus dissolubilis TaxID=1844116 RepID=UPI0011175547|nr:threonine/serine exporter family protein [Brevibacillus dissolubilis]